MYSFFERVKWKLHHFMQGRYGADRMILALYALGLFFWLISVVLPIRFFVLLSYLFYFYALARCLSRNHAARRRELAVYDAIMKKPRGVFRRMKRRWQDRKTHRYFKCKCGTFLRVPKGKGKIRIHCQKCNRFMVKRT